MDPDNEKPKPFKLGPQVWQLIAVLLLALAIPLTITIMGFKSLWEQGAQRPQGESPATIKAGNDAENPALRDSLEKVAEKQMPLDISLDGDVSVKDAKKSK